MEYERYIGPEADLTDSTGNGLLASTLRDALNVYLEGKDLDVIVADDDKEIYLVGVKVPLTLGSWKDKTTGRVHRTIRDYSLFAWRAQGELIDVTDESRYPRREV